MMRSKKGITLVIVLGVIMIVVSTVVLFITISMSERRLMKKQNDSIRAFYMAEAGLEDTARRLNNDSYGVYRDMITPLTITGTGPGITYSVVIDVPSYDEASKTYTFHVASTGTSGNSRRKIEQTMDVKKTWIFSQYMLYFGGNSDMLTYTFVIDKEASITGDIFANGLLTIGKDFYLDGDAYATGNIIVDGESTVTGGIYPYSELPGPPPTLSSAPYDAELASALLVPAGDQDISGPISGTIYVNGTATITDDVSVAGGASEAMIVATGDIVFSAGEGVGDNIELIAGESVLTDADYSVGNNCLIYATDGIDLSKEGGAFGSSGMGSVIITPGDVGIAKGFGFYGFIFADGEVSIKKECVATGVIAGNGTLTMDKSAILVHKQDVVDFEDIPGFTGFVWLLTARYDWAEVVPAD